MTRSIPEPAFLQAERRSLLGPALIALGLVGVAFLVVTRFFPPGKVDVDYVRTKLLATETTFKSQSIVVGSDQVQDVLFVATTVRIRNGLHGPITLDDFSLTYSDFNKGSSSIRAVQKSDLPNLQVTFPALKPLLVQPLSRDTIVEAGKSIQSTLLFSIPVSKDAWSYRKSAIIKVDVYHHDSLYVWIPQPPVLERK